MWSSFDDDLEISTSAMNLRQVPRSAQRGGIDPELEGGVDIQRENLSLRRRLDEESVNYRRRLDTYKQAQQHQAALVSRLQAKVF
jgi:hypothetical protein